MIEVTEIRQELRLPLSPHEVYETLLDAELHPALTGLPCLIERTPGGRFEVGENMIVGTLLEIILDQRIVQTRRICTPGWPAQHFSKLRLDLRPTSGGTLLMLEQSDVSKECWSSLKRVGLCITGIHWAECKRAPIIEASIALLDAIKFRFHQNRWIKGMQCS